MNERELVNSIVKFLKAKGYTVATEVANLYRSADIAVLDDEENIWIIECKLSSIGRAILQSKIHKISADKVFIGTIYKNTRESTLDRIKEEGLGLIYVMPDGSVSKEIEVTVTNSPWLPKKEILRERIMRAE